jgi:hypothetical protein
MYDRERIKVMLNEAYKNKDFMFLRETKEKIEDLLRKQRAKEHSIYDADLTVSNPVKQETKAYFDKLFLNK